MDAVTELSPTVGTRAACDFLGVARASFYRQRPVLGPAVAPSSEPAAAPVSDSAPDCRPVPARALGPDERASVLAVLHEQRFQDRSPAAIQATLLDEGQYLCSARTMYRLLEQQGESRERRDQLVHPPYQQPELLATAPNQLWSWDITKLLGPAKWTYFYLYVILDVFSRYVTGWMVAHREGAELAKQFIQETIGKHQVPVGQLNIHADRGRVMTSKPLAFLMADLGVTKTHSRPYVSDDNPYSESQFRTMKYRPEFPIASAASKTAAPSVSSSSSGTTTSTATPASACSPRRWFISARPRPSWPTARRCSMPLTKRTRTASFGGRQNHCPCPPRFGSTSRFHSAKRRRKKVSKLSCRVSQNA